MKTAAFVALAVLMAACGSSTSTGPEGYLRTYNSPTAKFAEFIHIAHDGSSLSGTDDAVSYRWTGNAGWEGPTIGHYTLTGNDDGSRVSLTFAPDSQTGGTSSTRSGDWKGASLVLDIPQTDGSLATVSFNPASLTEYNTAVKALG